MQPPKPPFSWTTAIAKWGSAALMASAVIMAVYPGIPNIASLLHTTPVLATFSDALSMAGGIVAQLAFPLLTFSAGLVGFKAASTSEALAKEVRLENNTSKREQKMGMFPSQDISVLMEPEGKPGKFSSTAAWLLGLSALVGGVMVVASSVIGFGPFAGASPIVAGLVAAVGATLTATAGFARNARAYADAPETDQARREILTGRHLDRITTLQAEVGRLQDVLDQAIQNCHPAHPQFEKTWTARLNEERLQRMAQAAKTAANQGGRG